MTLGVQIGQELIINEGQRSSIKFTWWSLGMDYGMSARVGHKESLSKVWNLKANVLLIYKKKFHFYCNSLDTFLCAIPSIIMFTKSTVNLSSWSEAWSRLLGDEEVVRGSTGKPGTSGDEALKQVVEDILDSCGLADTEEPDPLAVENSNLGLIV